MSENQRVRRCAALSLQPEDRMTLDFAALLGGREAVRITQVWHATAAHLGHVVELDAAMVEALGLIGESRWQSRADVAANVGTDRLRELIDLGLVLVEDDGALTHRQDSRLRDMQWHSLAAVGHMFSRWSGVDSVASQNESTIRSTEDLIAKFGPPPPHFHGRPVYSELTRRLRMAGAAGATTILGDWGFSSDEHPHGDRFGRIASHRPTYTVYIDRPDRVAEVWPLIDEVTAEHAIVTSLVVPGYRERAGDTEHGALTGV